MDIVVRTPHGDADISIVRHGPDATLGDVIVEVTGQAVPRVARVDDRVIDCSTLVDDVELSIGSVVTTDPMVPEPGPSDRWLLAEIAGPGAGRMRSLSVGRYRTGPGRRVHADELSGSVVIEPAFELMVTADGVTVEPPGTTVEEIGEVRIDGALLLAPMPWVDEIVTVGNRAFVVERRPVVGARRLPSPDPDGTVVFNRSPLAPAPTGRRPVIDALRDACELGPTLWQRRPGHANAFVVPIGVRERADTPPEIVELDLSTNRAVAVAGDDKARAAIARAILIEATTIHGPADLAVVVATTAERVSGWDWTKWLPHVRSTGVPLVLESPDDVARWVDGMPAPSVIDETRDAPPRLTLLVIDDPELWRRRDAPVRALLSTPPTDLRVLALCDDAAHAPSLTTTLITESSDGHWCVTELATGDEIDDLSAASVDTGVAEDLARALAPLTDNEARSTVPDTESTTPGPPLTGLLGDPTAPDMRRRWADASIGLVDVPLGERDGDPVGIDLSAGGVVIVGNDDDDDDEAVRTAVALAVAACTQADPASLLLLDLIHTPLSAPLAGFPHATDRTLSAHDIASIEPARLVARLRHVAFERPATSIIIVAEARTHDTTLVDALLGVSRELAEVCVIVAVADDDVPVGADLTTVSVDRANGSRRAVVDGPDHNRLEVLLESDAVDSSALVLRPAVLGRALTPLEHRIALRSRPTNDSFIAECEELAGLARAASDDTAHPPALVPPPLPTSIDTETLFRDRPGDAIPFGVVDTPATAPSTMWWEPDGSLLLALGSAQSGVDDLVTTIILGVIDRFSPDDVDLVVVHGSAARRRTIETLQRCNLIVAPDQVGDLTALIAALEQTRTGLDPHLVVLVDDLGHLRTLAAAAGHLDRLDRALSRGASVVAVARRADDCGPLLELPGRRLVAFLLDPEDEDRFEFAARPTDERVPGRCQSIETGEIVQLASSGRPLSTAVSDRLDESESRR